MEKIIIQKMNDSKLPVTFSYDIDRGVTDTFFTNIAAQVLNGLVLYCHEARKWLVWNGQRWVIDPPCGIFPHVKNVINALYSKALSLNDSKRISLLSELIKLESHSRQVNLVKALSVIPKLAITGNCLDENPMLLNCLNGTIDLSTGNLLLHNPNHRITKIVNCEYKASESCPIFLAFLDKIFGGNNDLIEYIKRFFGYCLTGKINEQVLVFFYGTGGNGKSTLIDTFIELLNDYSVSAPAELLMLKNNQSISNDIARLKGSRIVAVNEVEEDAKLAEAKIKSLTGGDTIAARFLFQEFIEFTPKCKFILVGNHKPAIKGSDEGIWRRIHEVPFTVKIREEDKIPNLKEKIREEFPGILAWAVQGCLEWQEKGLLPPAEVLSATKSYRRDEDTFTQWIENCCELENGVKDTADNLLSSFKEYCGLTEITPQKFTRKLNETSGMNGIQVTQQKLGGGLRVWHGIRVASK